MKLLNGLELAGYIKERQAKQVRNLRQSWGVVPKLAIIQTTDDPVIGIYVRLKQQYGQDILIDVELHKIEQAELENTISRLNEDSSVHGIIIQLPLANPSVVDTVLELVTPEKDVDGLGSTSPYAPATPLAIDWLLAGYNITLLHKRIAIVGQGRLVGAPLAQLWRDQGLEVETFDGNSPGDLPLHLRRCDIVISATGQPQLITSKAIKVGAVVVDAGTASENGQIIGDVSNEVRQRDDVTITPVKGGVGPLTIAALFDNVITAARKVADSEQD